MENQTTPTAKRQEAEIIKDLVKEEKIEEDLILIYSELLESGIAECLDHDLIDNAYKNLTALKDESVMHRIVVADILKKFKG